MNIYKDRKLNNILSKDEIFSKLSNKHQIEIFDEIESTNTYLKKCDKSAFNDFYVVISNSQTNGRGRMNRDFFSPKDSGIYLSILLFPTLEPKDCVLLTTAAAVAVRRAIEETLGLKTQFKWVNDIYCNGKKLCGILTESSINTKDNKLDYAIIGIGINFKKTAYPSEISNIATSLEECTELICNRNTLIASILNNLENLYLALPNKDYMKDYCKNSFLIGKEVTVIKPNYSFAAVVLNVDDNANLIVKDENKKIHTLYSGEVSLKL